MKAVIYARYSSSSQREESIEGQIKECTEYAERNGYTIIGTYADRAISGTTDNRPQFQKMITDSKRKLFDLVIVWKLDRFARNRYDSARYKNHLKKNGVKVISATEIISQGAEGILLESVLEGMAEWYSEDLKEKVVRGLKVNAEKCKWNGGTLPIGYIVDEEQHLQLNTTTAPFVLEAFKKYDDGHTITEIRDYLNSKGITNTKGRSVTWGAVQHMLSNRRYIGEYAFRDTVIPNGIPVIIPIDLFERVQERLAKNKKAPARNKADENYLLTTKLFCGHCGTAMNGESGKSRNGTIHRYYKCHAVKKRLNDCKKKSVKKEWIEDLIVNETMAMLMDDAAIEAIVSMLMRLQDEEKSDLPMYEKQLAETETAIDNIVTAVMNGMASKALQAKLAQLEAQKEEIQIRIDEEKLEKPKISAEFMTFWLHKFRKLDVKKEAHRQMLIDTFVNAVFVHDDKLLLTFNFKDGTRTITLTDAKIAEEQNTGSTLDCLTAPKHPNPKRGWDVLLALRNRTSSSGTVRWTVSATSANTGGFLNFCGAKMQIDSGERGDRRRGRRKGAERVAAVGKAQACCDRRSDCRAPQQDRGSQTTPSGVGMFCLPYGIEPAAATLFGRLYFFTTFIFSLRVDSKRKALW